MPSFWSLAAILLHIAGLLFALHALTRPYSPQGTLTWMLALVLLPLPSIPIYLILDAHTVRQQRRSRATPPAEGSPGRDDLLASVAAVTGMHATSGNCIRLLPCGRAAFRSMAHAVSRAKHSVLVEFYIIRDDSVGSTMQQALCGCAAKGLSTCVIYDELGCHKLGAGYLKKLRQAGVHVASFNGRRTWWSSMVRLNYRNHRKLVIVDGETAFIGSANIGKEYLLRTPPWRDAYLRLQGPAVEQALESFRRDWERATGQALNVQAKARSCGRACCQLVPSGPDNACCNAWQLCLVEMAAQARKRLWLASPYLVPTQALATALQAASLRGVDVRILVPEHGDSLLPALALRTFLPALCRCGVRVLAYRGGFLHEKACVVDGSLGCIGTGNLDERSLRLNFELSLLCSHPVLVRSVARMLEEDMEHATPMGAADFLRRPLPARLPAYAARLLAPVL